MSVYTEAELRCDVGLPENRFACDEVIYALTGVAARVEARDQGWLVSAPGGRDFCARHRPKRGDL